MQCCEWRPSDKGCGLQFCIHAAPSKSCVVNWPTFKSGAIFQQYVLIILLGISHPTSTWNFSKVFGPILFPFSITASTHQRWQNLQLIGKGHIFPGLKSYWFRRTLHARQRSAFESPRIDLGWNQNLKFRMFVSYMWIQTLIRKAHAPPKTRPDSMAPTKTQSPRELINHFLSLCRQLYPVHGNLRGYQSVYCMI